ncbi:type II toxin-antitoxin system PemK/MazF family toxin [Jiangella rhizosphaerae]|uniref:Type II toxin-antitoxin system PemK/MazF family toxin n=1 Tax=Jiangella rhizosphaerae TaxID=2293569 RepID=A0A418KTV3_9ACTN|nr:type II toxin-antitoxin system PemK/MazF family toxin [Jiangella rhizosphaerae]RIQ29173.1 type II toxin-antitoxin system PemK/MazF family toxin [Jiangella rhizosphaerae]
MTVGWPPLRGEVWNVDVPAVGEHPGVVLSASTLNAKSGHITISVVTGTPGPAVTHVPLGPDAGLTRYDESYANVTDLHAVSKERFVERRGLCSKHELMRIESLVRVYLGL